jgi:hypothetical protein
MRKAFIIGVALTIFAGSASALAQKDKEVEPTSWLYFLVVKDDNGKPVRNAAVIMHAVGSKGNQERGDLELKTDLDGKTNYDGIPYGTLRVQVLAHGFQTFGEDYNIDKPRVEITIKLKPPQGQYSSYDDRANDSRAPAKDTSGQQEKKPN